MMKLKIGTLIATLCLSSAAFAYNCHGYDSSMCLDFSSNDSQGHYVSFGVNGMTSPRSTCVTGGEFGPFDNATLSQMVEGYKILHEGFNSFSFYQCKDRTCNNKVTLGTYNFSLSSSHGQYNVNPPHYTVHLKSDYGQTCSPDFAQSKFIQIRK